MTPSPLSFVRRGLGQWFDSEAGWERLCGEYREMDMFPPSTYIFQDPVNGDVSYVSYIGYNGSHNAAKMTYDSDHPHREMVVRILSPMIDRGRAGHHMYGDGSVCYVDCWSSGMRAIDVACQVAFWIKDYHDGTLDENAGFRGLSTRGMESYLNVIRRWT